VPGGSIRSAELETARGQHFWAVYIAKPGSKNAKRNSRRRHERSNSCCANGKTRRSGRRAPEKPLRDLLVAKVLIYGLPNPGRSLSNTGTRTQP
jgi:hypothetical protein